jgi:hypothetical protein
MSDRKETDYLKDILEAAQRARAFCAGLAYNAKFRSLPQRRNPAKPELKKH